MNTKLFNGAIITLLIAVVVVVLKLVGIVNFEAGWVIIPLYFILAISLLVVLYFVVKKFFGPGSDTP